MKKFLPIEQQLKRQGFFFIAGVDEAGRGPLAGPVVSAAVILNEQARLPGLDDSKNLSPKRREELFVKIIDQCCDYSITFVPSQTIDEVNILNATILANHLCIKRLKVTPDFVLIDGKDKQIIEMEFQTIIKGDSRVKSIAAASILAKVARDRLMNHYHKLYPEYGFDTHMGYGTKHHLENIGQFGPCEIHRKSFKIR